MEMTGGTMDREQALAKVAPNVASLREILAKRLENAEERRQKTFGAKPEQSLSAEQPQFKNDAIEAAKAARSMMVINKGEGLDGSIPLRYRLAMSEAQGTPQAPTFVEKPPAAKDGKAL